MEGTAPCIRGPMESLQGRPGAQHGSGLPATWSGLSQDEKAAPASMRKDAAGLLQVLEGEGIDSQTHGPRDFLRDLVFGNVGQLTAREPVPFAAREHHFPAPCPRLNLPLKDDVVDHGRSGSGMPAGPSDDQHCRLRYCFERS